MAFQGKWVKAVLVSGLLIAPLAMAKPHLDFIAPAGDESWVVSESQLRCGLSTVIPDYGMAYFEQYATKPPHFILRQWEGVQKSIRTVILAKTPAWKPVTQPQVIARTEFKPGAYGIYLEKAHTVTMLNYLAQGYQTHFNYVTHEGFNTTVALSPVRFQEKYAHFQRCLGGLLTFDYDEIRTSVIHFDIDSRILTDDEKHQLKRIVRYVAADKEVQAVNIEGYADDSGRKGYNNAISEDRAKIVQRYLLSLGIPPQKLHVTWFGELKPISRNDTDEGRLANRRVIVNVIKK